MTTRSVFLAITDTLVHPEVMSIAAATGMDIVSSADPREISALAPKASVIVVDSATASHVRTVLDAQGRSTNKVLLVYPEPGPIDWKLALKTRAADAFIIPAQATELLRALRHSTNEATNKKLGSVIALSSATGGAGCSTIAAALALYSHHHTPTVLIDADPCSGGIDLLIGCEDSPGVRWPDLTSTDGVLSGTDLVAALPKSGAGLPVLSIDRQCGDSGITEEKLRQVIAAIRSTHRIVIDIPAYAKEFGTVVTAADEFFVIIPPEVQAAAAAHRMLKQLREHHPKQTSRLQPVGVIRHRGWSGLRSKDVESIIGITVVAELSSIPGLPKKVECFGLNGTGRNFLPKALERLARTLLDHHPASQKLQVAA